MTRLGIFMLLAALLAVAYSTKETVFRPGKEYVYDYESQVFSGVPINKKILSGVKVKATVRLQMKSSSRVHLQVEDIKILKAMDEFTGPYTPDELIPEEMFSEVTEDYAEKMKEHVAKPIKFRYVDGRVSDVEVDPHEPYYSVNIKKGLLSLLHLNLQEIGSMDDVPADLVDIIKKNTYVKDSGYHDVFAVMEDGIDGECETIYAIIDGPEAAMIAPMGPLDDMIMKDYSIEGPAKKVVKVRNYANCKKRPEYLEGLLSNHICPTCSKTTMHKKADILTSTAHVDYILTGTRRNFLIHRAIATGKHVITPMMAELTQPEATVKQWLNLVKVQAPSVTIKPGTTLMTLKTLAMELPSHVTHGLAPYIDDKTPEDYDNMIESVEGMLSEAAGMIGEKVDPKTTTAIIEMISIAKKIPAPALAALFMKYAKEASSMDPMVKKKKEILLDIIPALAHPGSVMVIKKLLKEDVISEMKASMIIQTLSLTMDPSPKFIMELLEFTQEGIVKDTHLKVSCILAAGTLTHKVYETAKKLIEPYKKAILAEKHKIANEIRKLLEVATDLKMKVAVLKAIGNAGLPELLPQIKAIITDKTEPAVIHKYAIYSLRRIAPILKKKIHSILLPKFMNPKEPEEVRIAAFVVLMDSRPGIGMAQMIVHSLKTETSLQVGSLVYSYLKTLSYAKYPELKSLAHILKVAMISAKPFTPGIQYSKAFHVDMVAASMAEGIAIDEFVIMGHKSLIPTTIVSKLKMMLMGHSIKALEIGVDSHGMHKIAADLMGHDGMLKKWLKGDVALKDILKHTKYMDKKSHIGKLWEKMKIVEHLVAKFDASVYLKVLGNELTTMAVDAKHMEELIDKVKSKVPEIASMLHLGYHMDTVKTVALVDNKVKIPTVIGLPLALKIGAVAVSKIDAYVKVEGIPKVHEWILNWKTPKEAKVHLKLKPSMVTHIHAHLGIDATFIKAGAGFMADISVHMPVELKATYVASKKTIVIEYEVPQKDKTLFKVEASPVAFMKEMTKVPPTTMKPMDTKKITPDAKHAFEIPIISKSKYLEKSLGVGIAVAGNIVSMKKEHHMFTLMAGPQEIALKIYPGTDVPEKMEIKLMYISPGHTAPSVAGALKSIEVGDSTESKESYISMISDWGFGGWKSGEDSKEKIASHEDKKGLCEWSPVNPDTELIGADPMAKHEIVISMLTKGDEMKRYLAVKMAYFPVGWMDHQINTQIIGSPAVIPHKQYQKIAIDTVLKIPKYLFYEAPVPFMPEAEPVAKTTVICGAEGFTKKMIEAKMFVAKVVDDKLAGFTPIEAAIKMHFAPDLPHVVKKVGLMMIDYIKVLPYHMNNLHWKHMYIETEAKHKCELKAIIIPEENMAKLVVKSSWETIIISGFHIPEILLAKKMWKVPVIPHIADHMTDSKLFPGECKLEGDKVVTFDKVKYWLPDEKCEMVVAKDCSAAAEFAITAKKAPEHDTKKIVKVMGPDDVKVEIVPSGSGWLYTGDELVVKINGEKKMMTHPIIIREEVGKIDSPVKYVVKKEKGLVIIDAKILGLKVITDGDNIDIKASSLFYGKTCGLCGDYDGEKAAEFQGPGHEVYHKSDQYAVSYMIPDDYCKVEDLKDKYDMTKIKHTAEHGSCGILMKHAIKEEMIMGKPKKCISIIPVETCGLGCMEKDATTKTVAFHCLSADDPATDHMIKKARKNELHEYESKAVDVYGQVSAPAACVPVY